MRMCVSPTVIRTALGAWSLMVIAPVLVMMHASMAVASIPDANGVFHACVQKTSLSMRLIDKAVESCRKNEKEITWSATGPSGPAGPRGPSDGYAVQQFSFSAVRLSTTPTAVVTLPQLPAGSYVVNASIALVSTATTAGVTNRCELRNGDDFNDILSVTVQTTSGVNANAYDAIPIVAAFTLTEPTDVVATCTSNAPGTDSQKCAITAIRVADLHE